MSLNKILLIGNVGGNPDVRVTQDGRKLVSFSLATSERWRDKNTGDFKEKTEWHRIVVLSEGLAGIVEKYVKKGLKLYVEGSVQTRKWTDSNNIERTATEVILQGYNNKLEILEGGISGDRQANPNGSTEGNYERSGNNGNVDHDLNSDDEVPF